MSAGAIDGDKFSFLDVMLSRGVRHVSVWDAFGETGNVGNRTPADWHREEWWAALAKFVAAP